MKILAMTDIHGNYDAARKIMVAEREVDVIVLGGDITADGILPEGWSALFNAYAPVVLGVAGNMDDPSIDGVMEQGGESLNGRGTIIGPVGFFGVSGVPLSPLHAPYEVPEAEILRRAEAGYAAVQKSTATVFVPHAPPFDTALDRIFIGKHVGSRSVREFIERRQPDVVICGHIHEARGNAVIGKSTVINCGLAAKGYYGIVTIGPDVVVENRRLKD